MNPATPYLETLGVLLVAIAGFLLGWRIGKKAKGWVWAAAYAMPLVLTLTIAVARRIPSLEFTIPFKWLMMDRMEFVVLAFLITFVLTIPVARLPSSRQRWMVTVFMWLVVANYALLPFLMPALNYHYLRGLKNTYQDGVCLQSTSYTCGPAAAVTALKQLGMNSEEGTLAILAHTTSMAGTPADSLCAAINKLHQGEDIRCTYREYQSIAELKQMPVIAVVKFGLLVDHYVTVLAITETTVEIGDPLEGRKSLSYPEFDERWRHCGIVVEKIRH
jgi:predicted double-glycine peptidase